MYQGTFRIGLQVNTTDSDYAKSMIQGVSAWCRGRDDVSLVVFSGRAFLGEHGYEYQNPAIYSHLTPANIDGLIMVTGAVATFLSEQEIREYVASISPVPVVSVSVEIPGTPSVVIDNRAGMRILLEHLFTEHGVRRFAVVKGPDSNPEARERFEVIQAFAAEKGLSLADNHVFEGDFTVDYNPRVLRALLQKGPPDFDAIICTNDDMAIRVMHVIEECGYRVPEDIMVTGFDDIMRARHERTTLTTVSQDLPRQGRAAAQLLFELVSQDTVPLLTELPTRVMYRQSCGCISKDYEKETFVAITDANERIPYSFSQISLAGMDWLRMQNDVSHMRHYLAQLVSMRSMQAILEDIKRGLASFDVKSCVIVLFYEHRAYHSEADFVLPRQAEVVLHYDRHTGLEEELRPIPFDPSKNMLPPGVLSDEGSVFVASALFHRDVQLGYIVYEPGNCDPVIYETLCVQIAASIQTSLVFEARRLIQRQLGEALEALENNNRDLQTLSQTDELTGLYNRRGFVTLGNQQVDLVRRTGRKGLLVYCDMDGLKKINDGCGHEAGDRAIIAMGKVLSSVFRASDIVSRLGGDEFVVLATDIPGGFLESLRERVSHSLDEYNKTSGEPFVLSFSLGAIQFDGSQEANLEQLLGEADTILYEEKKSRRSERE